MSNKIKNVLLVVVAILVVLAIVDHLPSRRSASFGTSLTAPTCGGTVTCFTDLFATAGLTGNTVSAVTNLFTGGTFYLGGTTDTTAREQIASVGTCNAGSYAASSTLFAVTNPFAATSTVSISLYSTGQATSSTLQIGTSTAATGLSSMSTAPLVNLTTSATDIGTTTSSTIIAGSTTMMGSGQISSGSNTVARIVVGPTESVGAYSTSTATGAGAANYTPGFTCTYKTLWDR